MSFLPPLGPPHAKGTVGTHRCHPLSREHPLRLSRVPEVQMEETLENKAMTIEVLELLPQGGRGVSVLSFSPGNRPLDSAPSGQKEHPCKVGRDHSEWLSQTS